MAKPGSIMGRLVLRTLANPLWKLLALWVGFPVVMVAKQPFRSVLEALGCLEIGGLRPQRGSGARVC